VMVGEAEVAGAEEEADTNIVVDVTLLVVD
jgi:hypothetical protein